MSVPHTPNLALLRTLEMLKSGGTPRSTLLSVHSWVWFGVWDNDTVQTVLYLLHYTIIYTQLNCWHSLFITKPHFPSCLWNSLASYGTFLISKYYNIEVQLSSITHSIG